MAENKSILAFSSHKNDQQSDDGTAENITFSRKRLGVEMMDAALFHFGQSIDSYQRGQVLFHLDKAVANSQVIVNTGWYEEEWMVTFNFSSLLFEKQ